MSNLKAPEWAAHLNNPPAYKPKNAGIPDPPGYPSSQQAISSSKVATLTEKRLLPALRSQDTNGIWVE